MILNNDDINNIIKFFNEATDYQVDILKDSTINGFKSDKIFEVRDFLDLLENHETFKIINDLFLDIKFSNYEIDSLRNIIKINDQETLQHLLIKYLSDDSEENNNDNNDNEEDSDGFECISIKIIAVKLKLNLNFGENETNPLICSIFHDIRNDIIKIMLENGLLANTMCKYDNENYNALYYAIIKKDIELINLLIEFDADILDSSIDLALDDIKNDGTDEIVQLIKKYQKEKILKKINELVKLRKQFLKDCFTDKQFEIFEQIFNNDSMSKEGKKECFNFHMKMLNDKNNEYDKEISRLKRKSLTII